MEAEAEAKEEEHTVTVMFLLGPSLSFWHSCSLSRFSSSSSSFLETSIQCVLIIYALPRLFLDPPERESDQLTRAALLENTVSLHAGGGTVCSASLSLCLSSYIPGSLKMRRVVIPTYWRSFIRQSLLLPPVSRRLEFHFLPLFITWIP